MEENASQNIAEAYFTALGRERFSTYKISEPYRLPQGLQYYEGNSHKYYLFDSTKMEYFGNRNSISWDEAEAYCESLGGHLATLNTLGESRFVEGKYIPTGFASNNFLIGGTHNSEWITGEKDSSSWWLNQWNYKFFICEWE